jgi:4-hydroxy-4-methyl-2-oxoglutarate aldolase
MRVVGRAFTVAGPAGDNLWLHRAIAAAPPGSVLVATVGGGAAPGYGYWGEVMAVGAQARAIVGLVIDGGARDAAQMQRRGFPVFCVGTAIRGTGKDPSETGSVGEPIRLGDVVVRAGDLVVGDDDGVVVVPAEVAADAIAAGHTRDAKEQEIFARLNAGETTMDLYRLPRGR